MLKIGMTVIAAATLAACVESGPVAVSQSDTLSMTCASTHMQTLGSLPMRCGPQSVKPYTYQ